MVSSKFFASSLLVLSLLIPHATVHADFTSLTKHSRSEIMDKSLVGGLAAGAVAGSVALALTMIGKGYQNKTLLEQLKHADWSSILAVAGGASALAALVCGWDAYKNAPEWKLNELEKSSSQLEDFYNEKIAKRPFAKCALNNEVPDIKALYEKEGFPFMAAVSSLQDEIRCIGYEKEWIARSKNELELLKKSQIKEVSAHADSLLNELTVSEVNAKLDSLKEKLENILVSLKENESYLVELEEKKKIPVIVYGAMAYPGIGYHPFQVTPIYTPQVGYNYKYNYNAYNFNPAPAVQTNYTYTPYYPITTYTPTYIGF